MAEEERVRVDAWLWAVRVFRTRSAAKDACATGKVKVGESNAKPATKVGPGDEVFVKRGELSRHLRVDAVLTKRVGAGLVERYMTDLDPLPVRSKASGDVFEPLAGVRDRGAGRPTKRERRQMDRLRRG